jgi:hypothetical protein
MNIICSFILLYKMLKFTLYYKIVAKNKVKYLDNKKNDHFK